MSFTQQTHHGVTFHTADAFTAAGGVAHGFATRLGGVSTGPYAQLNLGASRPGAPGLWRKLPPLLRRHRRGLRFWS